MRTALVTGVGRRSGIGFAVARRLLEAGDRVVVSSWTPHDEAQPWGADDVAAVLAELGDPPHVPIDLGRPDAPAELVARARAEVGPLTALVATHARSAEGELATVTAADLDACWAVNARASVLLVQAFAAQYEPAAGPGRVLLFTSGQHVEPMPSELPYALSKAAIQGITATLAAALAPQASQSPASTRARSTPAGPARESTRLWPVGSRAAGGRRRRRPPRSSTGSPDRTACW